MRGRDGRDPRPRDEAPPSPGPAPKTQDQDSRQDEAKEDGKRELPRAMKRLFFSAPSTCWGSRRPNADHLEPSDRRLETKHTCP